ncbi:uncharacterized protein [Centruroides vittatus]|uniref:uncharacterized protein n=1 Tax=Centruroides vittatus TaxID=120091 RepID=UPI00350FE42A
MENECGYSNLPRIKTEYLNKDESQEGVEDKNFVSSAPKYLFGKFEQDADKKEASKECQAISGSASNGYEMPPANHYLRNAILDEVLSEKKMALLWSPQVIKFLQEQQIAKRTNF